MAIPTWLTAFIDVPAQRYDEGVAFWRGVTGHGLSAARGDEGEFVTLVPPVGDSCLRVQRTADGSAGIHLDLHHPDHEFRVLRSPGGLAYCEVSDRLSRRPSPVTWPDGHRSIADQVCIDIPPSRFDAECAFWSERTGWPLAGFEEHPEFLVLERPPEQPVRILLQRLDDERPETTAHLDVATDDRSAETARHEALGASVVRRHEWWTVLRDPVGTDYCIVDRHPRKLDAVAGASG